MSDESKGIRWVYATLGVFSVFLIGLAGLSQAGFGPCGPGNTTPLLISGVLSIGAILGSFKLLLEEQRALRLRTIPFYACITAASVIACLQLFIGIIGII